MLEQEAEEEEAEETAVDVVRPRLLSAPDVETATDTFLELLLGSGV